MQSLRLHLCGTLLYCLLSASVWAMNGPETAIALNQRMAATPKRCAGNQPDYACSGVLARPMAEQHPVKFWEHDTDSTARGSELLVYLRRDGNTGPLPQRTGYVLMSLFDALAQDKPYEVSARPAPDDVQVRNWDASAPGQLAVEALYFDPAQVGALLRGQRAQLEWFKATGAWLPLLRMAGDGFGFDQREQLYRGYQAADRLNLRYADTAASCDDASPSYNCNGVLIRATGASASFRSWNPTQNSISRDGVSFTYVRADTGVQRLASNEPGLIFDRLDQPVTHPVRLRCAYPANAATSSIPNSCRASCLSQGITTVAAWRARYSGSAGNSCAFSMEPTPNSAQFQLNIDVCASGGAHNEIIIGAWPQNIPRELPIEAIYYPSGSASLAGAKLIQRDYFQHTGVFMPVVRVNLTSGNGQVFTFVPQDQNP